MALYWYYMKVCQLDLKVDVPFGNKVAMLCFVDANHGKGLLFNGSAQEALHGCGAEGPAAYARQNHLA